jgi:hypothetical protein
MDMCQIFWKQTLQSGHMHSDITEHTTAFSVHRNQVQGGTNTAVFSITTNMTLGAKTISLIIQRSDTKADMSLISLRTHA